jgi:spore coat polysaccharide biosynthesis predicted glycosyltransferase SpsG
LKTKSHNIIFRASGGKARKKQLGMGHITRCMNLSKNLKNCKINFIIEDFGGVTEFLEKEGIQNIFTMKPNISIFDELKYMEKIIHEQKIDLVILDKYDLKINYCKKIKKIAKLIILTDLFKTDFPADLVVNGFIGFKNKSIKNKYSTKCLIGPKFQILNKNFGKKYKSLKKYDLIVTFGGFDENNIIECVLKVLTNISKSIKTKIILGPATIKTKKIEELGKKSRKFTTIINQTSNMANEINLSKFGLCAGGITTYEFAAKKVPFGIISQVQHQVVTAKEWEKQKMGINLGKINNQTSKKIEKFLNDILNKKITLNQKKNIVDGLGSKRVALEIKKILEKN